MKKISLKLIKTINYLRIADKFRIMAHPLRAVCILIGIPILYHAIMLLNHPAGMHDIIDNIVQYEDFQA